MHSVPTSPSLDKSTTPPAATQARMSRYRLAMAVSWTLVIVTLCWLPRATVHELEDDASWLLVPNFDKVVHAGIFIVFAVLWARALFSQRRLVWIALGGVGLAVVTEVGQILPVVGRDASVADALTDVIGVVVGLALAPFIEPAARSVESLIIRKTGFRPLLLNEQPAVAGEVGPHASS
jgi:VanZ family protein